MPRPFFGSLLADVLPQVPEFRRVAARHVVGDGHARKFHDAAFDRVHQREVADGPGEERALGVTRAAQEERRRGQVIDGAHAELALDRLDPGNPEARRLVVLLRFVLVLALQVFDIVILRPLAVAVMGLVVEHDDVLEAHQFGHDALDHLPFGFKRLERLAAPAFERGARALRHVHALAQLEGVVSW